MADWYDDFSRRRFLKASAAAGSAALTAATSRPLYAQASAASDGTYDYVVAGGGHNALVCAAYLARAGYSVIVLEANSEIGGNTATEKLDRSGLPSRALRQSARWTVGEPGIP